VTKERRRRRRRRRRSYTKLVLPALFRPTKITVASFLKKPSRNKRDQSQSIKNMACTGQVLVQAQVNECKNGSRPCCPTDTMFSPPPVRAQYVTAKV